MKKKEIRTRPVVKVWHLKDIQQVLKISRTTVYNWLRSGDLIPPIRTGPGTTRAKWSRDEVEHWVREGMPKAAQWKRMEARRKKKRA